MNTIIKVASAAGAITLAALSVYGSFGLCQHIIIAVDHWGNAAPGPTKPAVDATTDLLDLIRRPCASVDKNGHLLPDGPICEIDQAIHDIRKITTASGTQVQQTGQLIDATAKAMGTVGDSVKDTAGHLNKTADAATGTLNATTRFVDTLTIDSQTANRLLTELQSLIASYTATGDDLDTAIKTANGIMASPNVTIMLANGAQFTTTAVQLEQKLAQCTLHPTLPCVLKSDILFGAQVGGYLL